MGGSPAKESRRLRAALVNLPSSTPVVRRYMCSYNAPNFLFPPLELLSLAAIAKETGHHDALVIDAVAEKLSHEQVVQRLAQFSPDLVTTIVGFEIYEHDMQALKALREALPSVRFAVFGHYPTVFPHETLDFAGLDFVIRGEPELTFAELCRALKTGQHPTEVAGLTCRDQSGRPADAPTRPRVRHADELPFPDYSLVDPGWYSEFLMPNPFAVVQSARGCPYTCNFCVRSYGPQLVLRSPDNILEELSRLVERSRIRSFRFIDDTFNAIPDRTLEICRLIKDHLPTVTWTCLSRADTLDERLVEAMQEAGCRRVYIGVESGSSRILSLYSKDYGAELLPRVVRMLHDRKMEVSAFFMLGHPEETEDDFQQTLKLARCVDFDYAAISRTTPYPGTPLFEQYRDRIDFSLLPYRNRWKDANRNRQLWQWERQLYRTIYVRPRYVRRHAFRSLRHPLETLRGAGALMRFLWDGSESAYRADLV